MKVYCKCKCKLESVKDPLHRGPYAVRSRLREDEARANVFHTMNPIHARFGVLKYNAECIYTFE